MLCQGCGSDIHCPGCDVCPRCLEPLIYENEYNYDKEEACPVISQSPLDAIGIPGGGVGKYDSKMF